MVHKIETLLLLLGLLGVLAVVAERIRFPFPILLVLSGIAIAFVPGLPEIQLNSQLVFLLFLPPLIFSAAWNFPWEDFRANLSPIFGLAVGLVFATMIAVAFVVHWLIPVITLASGFVLGAIVSPPDAVAATAVLKNMRIPKRLATVLEGESLVNDSSGLVAYQFAVAAVVTGSFSLAQASADFFWQSLGGIFLGYVVGVVVTWVHRGLTDPAVEVTLTILTPYIAYLLAEKAHCSGVLAVVAAGLHLGYRSWEALTPESRIQRETIWKFIDYLLNGTVFILIGLQFPGIIEALRGQIPLGALILSGLMVSLVVIGVRFAWIFPISFIQKVFLPENLGQGHRLKWNGLVVASWSGMRGVVSLAAALALPEDFPHRHFILFLTFSVIFVTLIIQGLSLPWLVRVLKVEETESEYQSEARARMTLIEGVIEELDELIKAAPTEHEKASLNLWREHYSERLRHMHHRLDSRRDDSCETVRYELAAFPKLLQHVRENLADLRRRGKISEDVRKRIEYDFDLEEQRITRLLRHYSKQNGNAPDVV
jgi:monovalent cation/hydrogen antiporter